MPCSVHACIQAGMVEETQAKARIADNACSKSGGLCALQRGARARAHAPGARRRRPMP